MADVKKADLKSMNIAEDKLRQLKQIFPEAFAEGHKLDLDKLKLVLGENVEVSRERFGMNWPGKADCFKNIQAPSIATLIPSKDESIDFELTENLFIEGDNLEVLKLLQKSYYGKIKMIYIDPPYNTGSDFIYPDDYAENLDTYLKYTGQVDDSGRRFSTNREDSGRFHSKWMNMMYSRVYLARNLLKKDGVLFVNIGQEELSNLEKICNEIFGEENKISIVARVAKTASNLGTHFAESIDFILCYARNISELPSFVDEVDKSLYKKIEQDGARKGEKYRDDVAFYQSSQKDLRPNQKYFVDCPDGSRVLPPCDIQDEVMREGDGRWRWSKEKFLRDKHLLVFKETKTSPLVDEKGNKARWNIYTKSYLKDREEEGTLPRNILTDFINRKGADLIKKFEIPFDFPKPIELIQYLCDICNCSNNDIVLDFFAGSATTAHAVLDRNCRTGQNCRFVCIQLPELTAVDSEAHKAGYKTIAEIAKERIRRVIKKIQEDQSGQLDFKTEKINFGFKVFKLMQSNFKVWEGSVEPNKDVVGKQLEMHVDHINSKSSQDDILFELLLKAGFELTTKIEKISMGDKMVYSIEGGLMLICLEKELTLDVIKAMAEKAPSRVICLDEGFNGNDQLKTNAVQIMKSKSVEDFRTI